MRLSKTSEEIFGIFIHFFNKQVHHSCQFPFKIFFHKINETALLDLTIYLFKVLSKVSLDELKIDLNRIPVNGQKIRFYNYRNRFLYFRLYPTRVRSVTRIFPLHLSLSPTVSSFIPVSSDKFKFVAINFLNCIIITLYFGILLCHSTHFFTIMKSRRQN